MASEWGYDGFSDYWVVGPTTLRTNDTALMVELIRWCRQVDNKSFYATMTSL